MVRRLLMGVPTFLGITLLTFGIAHLAPGDPLQLDPESGHTGSGGLDTLRQDRGLDLPIPEQYGRWLWKVVRLDFGTSFQDGRPVISKLAEALPKTLLLSGLALVLAYLIAVPLGVWAALKARSWFDRALTVTLFGLYALPSFWVAVTLLLVFATARGLDWLPLQGLTSQDFDRLDVLGRLGDGVRHLVLPVACLTYGALASISRQTRSAMLDVLGQDFLRTARAKGLSTARVVWRHALPNALVPLVALLGVMLPHLIGGSVIVERIFGISGMGLLAFEAVLHRDYPTVMGITTLVALLTPVSMLLSDLLHQALDPRLRME